MDISELAMDAFVRCACRFIRAAMGLGRATLEYRTSMSSNTMLPSCAVITVTLDAVEQPCSND
jgi:hypothetical protein